MPACKPRTYLRIGRFVRFPYVGIEIARFVPEFDELRARENCANL